ncbi:hypothetical protein ACVYF0_19575 [Vibrio cholerae]
MKCKLCLENEDIQESHIIPDAFFRFVKDKNDNVGKYIEVSEAGNKLGQVSYSEKLLCRKCEQNFSKEFESYVIEFTLRNPKNIGVSSKRGTKQITFTNLDYRKLKLFQMSLLWRAAISSLDFYKYVQVEPEILELLRKSLCELTPFEPHILPCFMDRVFLNSPDKNLSLSDLKQSKSSIFNPKKTVSKPLGIEYVTFIFGGFEWRIWLHKCSEFYVRERKVINPSGVLISPIVSIETNELLLGAGVIARGNELKGKGLKSA